MNELEKLKDYLENEYRDAVNFLTHPLPWWCDPKETKDRTITRGLGAVMYAQELGVCYNDIESVYEQFKKCVEDIIPTKERRS